MTAANSQVSFPLTSRSCRASGAKPAALTPVNADLLLGDIPGWARDGSVISKTYKFKNYHETLAFVNASAWVSHREDHHPDLEVGYNTCLVRYTTHSAGGLSENDFICAAKLDALFRM